MSDWLKDVLKNYVPEDKLDSAIKDLNQELPKFHIPKERFNEVNEALKLTKGQVEETNKAMSDLAKKAGSVDEYEKKVSELTQKTKDLEEQTKTQIAQITKRSGLKELLLTNNVHKDAIDMLVDKYTNEVKVDDKGLVEADKIIEKIKAERPGLFITKVDESGDQGKNKKKDHTPSDDDAHLRNLFGLPTKK